MSEPENAINQYLLQQQAAASMIPPAFPATGAAMNQKPTGETAAPKQAQITPPAQQVSKGWIDSMVMGVLTVGKKVPIVKYAVNGFEEVIGDIKAAADGASMEEREAEKKARKQAEGLAKMTKVIDVDEPQPEEPTQVDSEQALRELIQEAEVNDSGSDERPVKRARTSPPPVESMVGRVNYDMYTKIANAMDDPTQQDVWTEYLPSLFPHTKMTDALKEKALAAHNSQWGFPAYLICMEMHYDRAAYPKNCFANWVRKYFGVPLDDYNGETKPLASMDTPDDDA